MHLAWKSLARRLAGIGLTVGLAGCYVPGGGWTLRTGLDVRTIRKPAAFVEMVDTKWDEWNRVSQFNLCEPGNGVPMNGVPMSVETLPVPVQDGATLTPLTTPPRLNLDDEHPIPPRGKDPASSAPPAAGDPQPVPRNEEVPIPPAPGNTSAGGLRDRAPRRRDVADPPVPRNRAALLPASAAYRPRPQLAEAAEDGFDHGPVTLDSPYAGTGVVDGDGGESRSPQNLRTSQRWTGTRPLIRPAGSSTNLTVKSSPNTGAWLFSKP